MLSRRYFFVALFVLSFGSLAALTLSVPASRAQNRTQGTVRTTQSAPPTVVLESDLQTITNCEGEPTQVRLRANARSPEGRAITYRWRTTGGRVDGDGANVTWDLAGARPGVYTATVEVNTGLEGDACMAFTSVPVAVRPCPQPRPVCPNVAIYCPDTVTTGQPVTFTAEVSGGTPGVTGTYQWTVSAGTIVSGQGTPSIQVDTAGLGGKTITATFEVLGYNMPCKATCTTQVPEIQIIKTFDDYSDIAYNDEKARLDPFAIWLQERPTAKGYIIVYPNRRGRVGTARRRAERARSYLVNERAISADRIVIIEGGARDVTTFQLRGVPPGAAVPRP